MKINEIIHKYLQEVDGSKNLCAHCHKVEKSANRSVCAKCAKEIDKSIKRKVDDIKK